MRLLRIGLPVASLVLTAGLVLSLRGLPSGLPDIDLGDVGVSGSTITMENPNLTGFGARGMAYDVTAERALQDLRSPHVVSLETISGRVQQPDGGWATLDASAGSYDSQTERLRLDENIIIRSHDGKRGFLQQAEIDLKSQEVTSDKPVRLEVPGGRIRADRMDVSGGGETIRLTGKVVVDMRLDGGSIYEVDDARD